ncbi:toxin-antitoxin system, toxin component [Streptomyces sp. 12297]
MGIRKRRGAQLLEQDMVRLCSELDSALGEPAPSDIDALIARMAAHLTVLRGRPVRILRKDFPSAAGVLSGLWLDRETEDVIVVVKSTSPFHALVILGHEIWHMMRGHCGSHPLGPHAATRLLGDELTEGQLDEVARMVAARKAATPGDADEHEAEGFGRKFGLRYRHLVEAAAAPRVLKGPAARIQTSLGADG